MNSILTFGEAPAGIICRKRTAAYAVITDYEGRFAVVESTVCGRTAFWLPGGGAEQGESANQTVLREIREELGFESQIQEKIGEAIQFFYAGEQLGWYDMHCTFFRVQLTGAQISEPEHQLIWLASPMPSSFFHACHAWAIAQTVR